MIKQGQKANVFALTWLIFAGLVAYYVCKTVVTQLLKYHT